MRKVVWALVPMLAMVLFGLPSVAVAGDNGCWVKVYASENYDNEDEWDQISGPGQWGSLENVPGAHEDWNEEINSVVVGPRAHAYFYKLNNWEGSALEVGPRRSIPDLSFFDFDGVIKSMKIRCIGR